MSFVYFNPKFFDEILKSQAVKDLTLAAGRRALTAAIASAPFETGDYRAGLELEVRHAEHRDVVRVVGHDKKTLLVEAKTGNLAKALRKAKG